MRRFTRRELNTIINLASYLVNKNQCYNLLWKSDEKENVRDVYATRTYISYI